MVINGQSVSVPLAGVLIGGLTSVADAVNQIDTVSALLYWQLFCANSDDQRRVPANKKRVAVDPSLEVFEGMTVRPSPDIHREKTETLLPFVNEDAVRFTMPKIDYTSLRSLKVGHMHRELITNFDSSPHPRETLKPARSPSEQARRLIWRPVLVPLTEVFGEAFTPRTTATTYLFCASLRSFRRTSMHSWRWLASLQIKSLATSLTV